MATTRVSTKYQVVIPKSARQRAKIKRGQDLQVYTSDEGVYLTHKKKWPDDFIGSQKDIWSKIDVVKYLREERNSWGD